MSKIIVMIPARLGSQRIPKKNLRYIHGKPLIAHCIETVKKCSLVDEIYINSEADIFRKIAQEYDVKFYKRPEVFSSNEANNDDFAYDFIKNISGDILLQVLPTSPLLTALEITQFIQAMKKDDYDSMISVVNHQIACVYDEAPINFSKVESHKSSQMMKPVKSYATVLMAWKYKVFIESMEKLGCAYHGGKGKTGYFSLSGLSTIDVDYEDEFLLAEIAFQMRDKQVSVLPKYYGEIDKE